MVKILGAAVLLLFVVSGCTELSSDASSGDQNSTAQSSTSVSVSGGSTSVNSSSSSSVSSGAACSVAGGTATGPVHIVAKSANGDTFTLTFDHGVPPFRAVSQPTSHFTSPTGATVDLAGSAGVLIILTGLQAPGDPAGPRSLTSHGSLMWEVDRIGDAGGVVIWAVGLKTHGCPSATVNGATLSFRFS
jgi:hypothetical protein